MRLYAILGVPTNATTAQIRAAYRRLAKKHHPDKGGDPAIFGEMSRANAILSDPEKRAKYDATGDEGRPDNAKSDVLQLIAAALEGVISDLDRVQSQNIPLSIKEALEMQLRGKEEGLKALGPIRAKVVKLTTRIKVKSPGAEDVISPMIEGRLRDLDNLTRTMQTDAENLRAAIAMVDGLDDTPEQNEKPYSPLEAYQQSAARILAAMMTNQKT